MSHRGKICCFASLFSLCVLDGVLFAQDNAGDTAPLLELKPARILKLKAARFQLCLSRDGTRLAASDGKAAYVWDTRTGELINSIAAKGDGVGKTALAPDGRSIAFADHAARPEILLVDTASGNVLRKFRGHTNPMTHLVFSPDGKRLASGASMEGPVLWDAADGKELKRFELPAEGKEVRGSFRSDCLESWAPLVFSPDGGMLAAPTTDDAVQLFDVCYGDKLRTLRLLDEWLHCPTGVAFSPDGRFLAVGANRKKNEVTVWDWCEGKPVWRLHWPLFYDWDGVDSRRIPPTKIGLWELPGVWSLAFTADGRNLIAACRDGRVRVWETWTGKLRYAVEDRVNWLAAGPAGRLIASCSEANGSDEVLFWDYLTSVSAPKDAPPTDPDRFWSQLTSNDAGLAFTCVRSAMSAPGVSSGILGERLPTAESLGPGEIDRLVKNLDDDEYSLRQQATRRLLALDEKAMPALKAAMAKSPSLEMSGRIKSLLDAFEAPPGGERLGWLRAIEILENIDSRQSREILKRVAGGAPGALLTREATAALERSSARPR